MRKVLTPAELATLLEAPSSVHAPAAEIPAGIIPPTARELLALTEQALGDVAGALLLTANQRVALTQAFEARLGQALAPDNEAE